jgi:hypothetical protein
MDIETRLMRLEIAFESGAPIGAQATVEEGVVDGDQNWLKLRERTFGLDAGGHPEYATQLSNVLGMAADQALATNRALTQQLAEHDSQIAALTEEKAAVLGERDKLQADNDRLLAHIATLEAAVERAA